VRTANPFSLPAAHGADTPEHAPTAIVAQQMVDKLVGQHPELLDVIFHVLTDTSE
jgi:hypothetical protein